MTIGKVELRIQARDRRARLAPDDLVRAARALRDAVLPLALAGVVGAPVAAYAHQGTEPGTHLLLAALRAAGVPVLLPVLRVDGDLDWGLATGDLVDGPRGTRHPPGTLLGRGAVADCTLVVVPSLAVDRTGTRLGQGGGCYDRALTRATGLLVAALHDDDLYDGERHDLLPREEHDRPVDAVVLPSRGLVRLDPVSPATGLVSV